MDYDYKNNIEDAWHRATVQQRIAMLREAGIDIYSRCACRGFDFLPETIQQALAIKFDEITAQGQNTKMSRLFLKRQPILEN